MRAAICGFQHGHMHEIVQHLRARRDVEIVAVAEAEPQTYGAWVEKAGLRVTHPSLDALLADADADLIAFGDAYGRRGAQVLRALEAGKHVLADKPLCTRLDEFARIEALAQQKRRSVIVALSLRYLPEVQAARRALHEGRIGRVLAAAVFGQHPLNYRTGRPDWYFQEGLHGGTINDILVHGVDGLAWLTGSPVAEVIAARAWNGRLPQVPHFQDCAQAFLRLANGAGVLADCSYLASPGHPAPWTLQFWGSEGYLRLATGEDPLLQRANEPAERLPRGEPVRRTYVDDLLNEIAGGPASENILTTAESLDAARRSLRIQHAADAGRRGLMLD